jgi:hypothetical protein
MSKKAKQVGKVIRLQVHEPDAKEISAFVQDLVVALADVCARLGRIAPEVYGRWSKLKKIGDPEDIWNWDEFLFLCILDLSQMAKDFDPSSNLFPSLLKKLNQKQDSEHCPVCQHASKRNAKFENCWYCREGVIETKGYDQYLKKFKTERYVPVN